MELVLLMLAALCGVFAGTKLSLWILSMNRTRKAPGVISWFAGWTFASAFVYMKIYGQYDFYMTFFASFVIGLAILFLFQIIGMLTGNTIAAFRDTRRGRRLAG